MKMRQGIVTTFVTALAVLLTLTLLVAVKSHSVVLKNGFGFREVGLKYHNIYRALNNVSRLELDQELNKLAHGHAEKLASWNNLTLSEMGFHENLWSHRGELLPLAKDLEYAIKCWYTGSKSPGHVAYSVDLFVLRSNTIKYVGFGVGTFEHGGQGYSVVVAFYQ